ncbi:RNA 2',3'-cyclic phosphodiesterase [Lentzea tibetensis]|uniref:RNA 2',3'-cyclic phosphodiesterase n=1 Tax=Lentzea tibetensis TaxID=2591470 RepID=A0A563ERA5_9PSEU|nr:2'-5' RNA ligase family protein [Lentzea tibetensis]TWP50183.1 RNA 2',3'-cyclic phosphodiesterase [Lentzea tibetensis]
MTKLFTALFPPPEVVAELDAVLDRKSAKLRWVKKEKWHVTLCFHGPTADLKRFHALAGQPAPTLRLSGFGTFRGDVLWAGVEGQLNDLAAAAGADDNWQAHLTIARGYRKQPLPEFTGAAWTATEAVLISSHEGAYVPIARVGLST